MTTANWRRESFFAALLSSTLWRVLERATGLLKHLLIAALIGLSGQLDAFYMGLAILGLLIFAWADVADVVGVPRMAGLAGGGREAELQKTAAGLFTASILTSAALTVAWLALLPLIARLAPGFSAEQRGLLDAALLWFTPVVFFYLPFRQLGGLFRATRRFSLFYKGELLISLVVLACIALFRSSPTVLFWSYSAGVFAGFLYLFIHGLLHFRLFENPLRTGFWDEAKRLFKAAPALLALSAATSGYVLVDRMFVSYLPEGSTGALAYGLIAASLLVALMRPGTSFVTVYAETHARGDTVRANRLFNDIFLLLVIVGVPCTMALAVFAEPLLAAAAHWGALRSVDEAPLVLAVLGLAGCVVPLLLLPVLDQVYFVRNRLGPLITRVLIGLAFNALLNAVAVFVLRWGVFGVGLATTISYWLMALLATGFLPRLGLRVEWRVVALQGLKTVIIAALLAGAGRYALDRLDEPVWALPLLAAYFFVAGLGVLYTGGRGAELAREALRRLKPF